MVRDLVSRGLADARRERTAHAVAEAASGCRTDVEGAVEFAAANQGYSTRYSTRFGNVRLRRLNSSTLVRETVRGGATGPRVRRTRLLFRVGEVGIRRRPGFVKEFDLLERIVPDEIRLFRPHRRRTHRELLRGRPEASVWPPQPTSSTTTDFRSGPPGSDSPSWSRPASSKRSPSRVESPAVLHPEATLPRAIEACTLLSPFDPVVWFRERGERLFDFEYKLEIYTRRPSGSSATTCCRS